MFLGKFDGVLGMIEMSVSDQHRIQRIQLFIPVGTGGIVSDPGIYEQPFSGRSSEQKRGMPQVLDDKVMIHNHDFSFLRSLLACSAGSLLD